jgi:PST family polysaccharide transporter
VLFPTMARLQERRARLRDAYLGASAVVAVVATPLSALLLVTAPELVRVLLGPGWGAVVDPFRVLAAGILFRASYPVGDALARGLGLMYRRSARDALYAGLVIGGSLAGLRFGLPGVAAGVLGAVAVNYVTAVTMSLPEVGASWRDYLRAQAPGLVLGAVVAAAALPTRLALEGRLPPLPLLVVTCLAAALAVATALGVRPNLVGEHGQASLRALVAAMEGSRMPTGVTRRLSRLSGGPQP